MSETQQQAQRWATFDCYGTLVNWKQGMTEALEAVVPGHASLLLEGYHQLEPEVETEQPFRTYRNVLAETLRRAAGRAGVRLAPGAEQVLSDTLPQWPVFPDIGPTLQALRKEGWKLAILSNVDQDLIAETLQELPVPFDAVVTAADVQAYKPALNHFHHFLTMTHVALEDWVHVACSYVHDITPAAHLGIKSVWINRAGSSEPAPLATAMLPDLSQLPATLQQLMGNAQ